MLPAKVTIDHQTFPLPTPVGQSHWRRGAQLDILDEIAFSHVNLCHWERSIDDSVKHALSTWVATQPPSFDRVISSDSREWEEMLISIDGDARSWLIQDISALILKMVEVTKSSNLRVSFGPVFSDRCRKFHVDYLRFRMITTYLGPGTEFVPSHAVNQQALAHPDDCPCDANQQIVSDPSPIRHAHAGDVLLMKGQRQSRIGGAVHRSPPIEHLDLKRVLLVLSTVDTF